MIRVLCAAAAMAAPFAMASTASAGTTSTTPEWHLTYDSTNSMQRKVVGTSCTEAEEFNLGRTAWNTVVGCNPYFTKTGKTAYHWTYLKRDVNSGAVCTSDGYLYVVQASRTYVGYCAVTAPRVPWSTNPV